MVKKTRHAREPLAADRLDPFSWRLYLITDTSLSRGRSHVEIARQAIAGGADVIQLREKSAPARELYETALQLRDLTRQAGVPFIIDDRVDIALAAGADGVHLGKDDLPYEVARRLLGKDKVIGLSAGSVKEAVEAEKMGADYIGFGPVFDARGTKPDAGEPLGLAMLAGVRRKVKLAVIAIGGIKPENARDAIEAGANGVAVISAIVSADDIAEATRLLKEKLRANWQDTGGGN